MNFTYQTNITQAGKKHHKNVQVSNAVSVCVRTHAINEQVYHYVSLKTQWFMTYLSSSPSTFNICNKRGVCP